MNKFVPVWILALALMGCGGKNSSSNIDAPGDEKTVKDKTLNAGAELMQDKTPLKGFSTYLDGFHFYNGNINSQMEAHHYVNQINDDVYQAIIFDGNGKDAKIMGVEYIITAPMFARLAPEEKKLWHSHHHEVSSGSLIAPGIPEVAEHELMEKLVSTYGKTIHTWHTDQEKELPIGSPMIMMGFTKDGQLNPGILRDRDKRFNISSAQKKLHRKDIRTPEIIPGANAWEKGEVRQLVITDKVDSVAHKH
ncbi:OBAP family protein [Dyadobacter chenwenxiniae]|uniref:OBAP family protein n=1 Tax=Dyadobacter chenwenxiniae TaxID=2906456 RepID=A0A9X1PSZ1_9BACT|nr:OBAP family protein [Dyadobacter chenwenxiniae]MCF0064566.1 OBAP family protein [Dyadobacter chenwenxiniae]UON84376.1 OBAP family protein [Dyadobacter chenwenxiniae]